MLSKQHGGGLSSSWQEDLHVVVRAVPGVRSKSLLAQSSDLRAQDSFKILPLSHTLLKFGLSGIFSHSALEPHFSKQCLFREPFKNVLADFAR